MEARLHSQRRCRGSGRRGASVFASVLTVCEAIAVAVQLEDVDVMGQPVEQRAGERLLQHVDGVQPRADALGRIRAPR